MLVAGAKNEMLVLNPWDTVRKQLCFISEKGLITEELHGEMMVVAFIFEWETITR